MKNLLLGSVALAVLFAAGPATAADMPVKAPIGAPPIVSIYNWSGFYVGANAGWGFAEAGGTEDNLVPNPGEHGAGSGSRTWNGFIGGGQIGYNWMAWRNVVLGIEADLSFANLKDNYPGISKDGISFNTTNIDRFGTVRGRIGYAFDNWLIYGTGGAAWTHAYETRTQGPCPAPDAACTLSAMHFPFASLGAMDSNTHNLFGWTVGAGVEVGITSHWTTKLEYLYMDFGSFTDTNPVFNRVATNRANLSVVRLGLNYKFN
jgi:outer membrane immunogenic protein